MELTRAVGENIKRLRKTKKLSMERLAAESGVSRSMLGQIERGEANPSVAILGKLAAAQAGFTDVAADRYYADAVNWAAENGVTNGISETLFGPDGSCTRAQIVTFLYRAYQGK